MFPPITRDDIDCRTVFITRDGKRRVITFRDSRGEDGPREWYDASGRAYDSDGSCDGKFENDLVEREVAPPHGYHPSDWDN